ncbi:MAG: SDR family NAD(P)-dependent oxidoreductase [Chloroflexi bacterium]|nr:SDR family NAD(P)-dependent oxidoreductase [Chloroflexota bacterium]
MSADAQSDTPVALITGASRGLGAVLSHFLSGQGYQLVITARGAEPLLDMARQLAAPGSSVIAIPGDVRDPAHRRELARAAQSLGRLDILINNASELGPSPLPELERFPLNDLLYLFGVNVAAPLGLIQETLPLLKASAGLIVNISSDAALGGYPGWGGYGASKAALDLISLTLANELEDVAVVVVDPGDMRTDMQQRAFPGEDISDRPAPEVTLPFWAWLFGQERRAVSGQRYRAQAEQWETAHAAQ